MPLTYTKDYIKDTELGETYRKVMATGKTFLSDYKFYAPSNMPASFIGAPVYKGENIIGAVIFQLNNEETNNVVQNYIGLGETGEVVVASRDKNEAIFLFPLRHDSDAAFRRRVPLGSSEALPIQHAVKGEEGYGISIDYRRKEILAAWSYLPELKWGMVVKIDAEEAFQHIYDLRNRLLLIGVFTILLVIIISIRISKTISYPIKESHKGSQADL